MSEYLNKIVYLTEAQYNTIKTGGTVSGQSYDASTLYITNDSFPLTTTKGGTGLNAIGTAGQVLKVNSGATGLEWGTVSTTDTKVTQAYSTTSNSYPLLMSATAGISATTSRGDTTAILNNQLYANPSTGQITATGGVYSGSVYLRGASFVSGNEGGEIEIVQPPNGSNSAIIDVFYNGTVDQLRFRPSSASAVWVDLTNKVLYGAAWNDYAEYRQVDNAEAGRVVQENDNGIMTLANSRLIPAAAIISDTYGFAQGQSENANTPIAVAGRVLVYPYQVRENYHAGMAVCSAPNGTVDIMTQDEIKEYPNCIIGYVSEIPQYEKWGSSNVAVNGRIWVRVK